MKEKGISGSTVKIIAVIAMLLDHIGAVILERMVEQQTSIFNYFGYWSDERVMSMFVAEVAKHKALFLSWASMRLIGRIGFPIFCFLLVEGFLYTRSVWKYMLRLFVFALVSEIPFNLALSGSVLAPGYQNVFFTLLIGLLAITGMDAAGRLQAGRATGIVRVLVCILAAASGCVLAECLATDYAGFGVFCIVALYLFRKRRKWQLTAGIVLFGGYSLLFNLLEVTSVFAFIPIGMYNGKRGIRLKYFFYAFYPVHLFLLYLAAHFMGLA